MPLLDYGDTVSQRNTTIATTTTRLGNFEVLARPACCRVKATPQNKSCPRLVS